MDLQKIFKTARESEKLEQRLTQARKDYEEKRKALIALIGEYESEEQIKTLFRECPKGEIYKIIMEILERMLKTQKFLKIFREVRDEESVKTTNQDK